MYAHMLLCCLSGYQNLILTYRDFSGVRGFLHKVQIDLGIMYDFGGWKYFLLLQDVYSRRIFTAKLKTKSKEEVLAAMNSIFMPLQAYPTILGTYLLIVLPLLLCSLLLLLLLPLLLC